MLKRNIAVIMIAGGLVGAHVNLAAAQQAAFPGGDRPGEISPGKVSYLEGRAASGIYAEASGSSKCDGPSKCDDSPFPWDNSKD